MIPLIVPRDNFIINLLSVSTVESHPPGTIGNKELAVDVKLTDGRLLQFEGQEAGIVLGEINFAMNAYRTYQQAATGNGPLIVTPENARIN